MSSPPRPLPHSTVVPHSSAVWQAGHQSVLVVFLCTGGPVSAVVSCTPLEALWPSCLLASLSCQQGSERLRWKCILARQNSPSPSQQSGVAVAGLE